MKKRRKIPSFQIIKGKERGNRIREEIRVIKGHIIRMEKTGEDNDAAGYTYWFGASTYITFEL